MTKSALDETQLIASVEDGKSLVAIRRVMYTAEEPIMIVTAMANEDHFFWARLSIEEAKKLGAALLGLAATYEAKR